MAPLRASTTKSEWLPDDPTGFVPSRLWKLPSITTWDDSRNQNHPTDSAEEAFFKGVLYGNRGTGKSTEINRLVDEPTIRKQFIVVRLDALDQLNPQTFSVADVLLLLGISLVEGCLDACERAGRAFNEAYTIINECSLHVFPEVAGQGLPEAYALVDRVQILPLQFRPGFSTNTLMPAARSLSIDSGTSATR